MRKVCKTTGVETGKSFRRVSETSVMAALITIVSILGTSIVGRSMDTAPFARNISATTRNYWRDMKKTVGNYG